MTIDRGELRIRYSLPILPAVPQRTRDLANRATHSERNASWQIALQFKCNAIC